MHNKLIANGPEEPKPNNKLESMKRLLLVLALIPFAGMSQKNVVVSEDPAEVIARGIELYDNEKYAEAIEEFDKININDTSYANAQYEAALAYFQLENYKKSQDILEDLLDYKIRFNFKHKVYLLLGNAYDEDKNPQKAIEVYTEGLKMYPHQHNLFYNRGLVYENEKEYLKAFEDYKRAVQGNMYHANSHLRLGIMAANEGYYEQALMSMMMFCYLVPDDSRAPSVAILMDRMSNGSYEQEKKNIQLFDTDLYEDYNLMFINKNALESKVKVKLTIPTSYGKQLFFFLKNNHFVEGNLDFWNQHYMRFYDEVFKKKAVDQLTMVPLIGLENEEVQASIKKNFGKLKAFYEWARPVFKKCASDQYMEFEGKMQDVYVEYTPSHLDAIGHVKDIKGQSKPIGNFYYYHPNGLLSMIAHFDDNGNAIGTWEIYNDFDGNIERKVTFTDKPTEKFQYEYYFSGELYQKYRMMNDLVEDSLVRYYRNGTVKEYYIYKNNKRNGPFASFYPNGSKREELSFKDGKRVGSCISYHRNGQKDEEFTFVDDKADGAFKSYYPNGQVKSEYTYKQGKYDGPYTEYFSNGQVWKKGTYKNGVEIGDFTEYWSNGSLLTQMNLDESGKQNGISTSYDFDGKKFEELEFSKGDLKSVKYFDKAGTEKVMASKKGKTLDYVRTYSNGKMSVKGTYVDNEKQGDWYYYDRYGNTTRKEKYKDGTLMDTLLLYFSNGQIKKMFLIEDGDYNGLFLEYNIFGDLISEGTFSNGNYDKAWYSYYQDGSLSDKNYYVQDYQQGFQISYDITGKMDQMEEYDNGRIIAHTFFDTTETITMQIGEYNGEIRLKDPTNQYDRLIAHYKNGYADGDFTWYYMDNKISCKGAFKNNERVGKWTYYDLDGKITREIDYVNGEINGFDIQYYENGNKRYEIPYLNGSAEGPFKFYHFNGKVQSEGNFLNDERHGKVTYYSSGGQVQMIRMYHLGTIISYTYLDASGNEVKPVELESKEMKFVTYYKNGKKSNEHFRKNGLIEGKYISYHDNGKIADESNYEHGEENGINTDYNEQGQKISEVNYAKGKKHGKSTLYYANGKIKEEANYIFGNLHGERKLYSPEGKLTTIITYYDDEIIQIKTL